MSTPPIPKETLPHLIRRALSDARDDVLVERVNGAWTPASSGELLARVENLACAIREAGLGHGDRVALIAHDCIDWIVCDFATFFAGCVVVPVYPTQAVDLTAYILRDSGAKLLFIDTPAALARLRDAGVALPPTYVFEETGEGSLLAFEAHGASVHAAHPELPQAYETHLQPGELAVLIYTSGTTGEPKGVMLSHDNLGFNAQAVLTSALGDVGEGDIALSVLPFSHIYEHTFIYIYLLAKTRFYICHDANELLTDLIDVRPNVMTSVPRIFDRVLAGVAGKAMKAGGAQAKLVPWAIATGREYMYARTFGSGASTWLSIQYAAARALVLKKIRNALGLDRIKYFCSGSAALHIDVAMTYVGLGLKILQGYGLTETSPVITCNTQASNRYGTVGRALQGVEVKIAPDGEILTRGRHVMHGYYRQADATAEALEADGWFHTGDIGEIDGDGYLRITDRKKEVFKTATGKYVSPARVESAMKRSIFVAQAMVIGDGRAHPAALVAPNWDLLRVELGLPVDQNADQLARRKDVVDFMTAQARKQTEDLATYEQIRRIIVLPREFTVESGELSPAMKIKRRVVEHRYAEEIENAYRVDLHATA